MKVLYLNGFFLLPPDFKGTEVDAIKLLAEYHRLAQSGDLEVKPVDRAMKSGIPSEKWVDFLAVIGEGYRVKMGMFCGEFVDGKWVRFEPVEEVKKK